MGVAGVDSGYLRGFGNEFESEALPAGPHKHATPPCWPLLGTSVLVSSFEYQVRGITNCITLYGRHGRRHGS